MSQKIFIKTFGCQMNEYDSNRIYDSVKKIGYEKTENYEDANCYLLNTCHIRDKAKEKVYHEIGRVKKIFRSKRKPLVIIAGCVAQAENQEMLKREPYIDLVIGPQTSLLLILLVRPTSSKLRLPAQQSHRPKLQRPKLRKPKQRQKTKSNFVLIWNAALKV